jgi:uncharacterized membrane protein (UPF0182 family)
MLALLLLILAGSITHLLTESWWFDAVGFSDVFWTRLFWRSCIWLGTFACYAVFLYGNYRLALWLSRESPWRKLSPKLPLAPGGHLPRYAAIAFILLISLQAAMSTLPFWDSIPKFLNATPFNQTDPLFQRDISFYFFRLPIYEGLQHAAIELLLAALMIVATVYLLKGEIRPERGWKYFLTGDVKSHVCLLLAALAAAISIGFLLKRYDLLFSPHGVVYGAGYTDVHARLHAYWVLAFVTLAVGLLFILSIWRSGFVWPLMGIALYFVVLIVIGGGYPWLQQRLVVEPTELSRERPYIEHSIDYTNAAYALDQVQSIPFPVEDTLTATQLSQNAPTLDNIRLWDYRPLLSTYRQLQEIRLYYRFQDVDIDRYTLPNDYRQVALSARELDYTQAAPEAQTWVNQRLKFTHGFGVVLSPVNQVTPDGLPELWIKNVPPVSSIDIEVTEPRIYYGEVTNQYVFTGATTDEFDYPQGDTNAPYRYQGKGGVPLNSFLRRLAYAYDFGNLKLLISNYINRSSRIHYYRTVRDRARQIAPFLTYDSDPYIAIIEGRLKWILDAYTTSDRYPYSEPLNHSNDVGEFANNAVIVQLAQAQTNYLRDAAKVVIDAYDGTVEFFVIDEADPILATYRKIFPNLFISKADTPSNLRSHFRYPYDLFTMQAKMYRAFHMSDPEVFYNREDLWRFPTQVYEEQEILVEPYHTIMRLPNADQETFIQILPFTPSTKDNMVAWMAGASDGEDYGKLLLYEFPKQELVYGPRQIEARIDQTPEISEQLTLWSQQGSRVIRGDLLVIPIEQSLLYMESIYLRADQGELPALSRVVVAYGENIVMRESLDEALLAIFGDRPEPLETVTQVPEEEAKPPFPETPALSTEQASQIQAALDAFAASQEALAAGNWEAYGKSQAELERILKQLSEASPE